MNSDTSTDSESGHERVDRQNSLSSDNMEGRRRKGKAKGPFERHDEELNLLEGESQASHSSENESEIYLVDQVWYPLKLILVRPYKTAYIWGGANFVFVSLGELHRLLVYLLTFPGLLLGYLAAFYMLTKAVARALVYPAYVSYVLRGIEKDCSRDVKRQYVTSIEYHKLLLEFLLTTSRNEMPKLAPLRVLQTFKKRAIAIENSYQNIMLPMRNALILSKSIEGDLKHGGEDLQKELLSNMDNLVQFYSEFKALFENCCVYDNTPCETQESRMEARQVLGALLGELREQELMHQRNMNEQSEKLNLETKRQHSTRTSYSTVLALYETLLRLEKNATFLEEADGKGNQSTQPATVDHETFVANMQEMNDYFPFRNKGFVDNLRLMYNEYQRTRLPLRAITSIDYFRADLLARFNAKQIWIAGARGTKLDAVFVPANYSQPDNRTIIICNPNAAVYEFALFQCRWLSFYTERGINVLLYNYRGYGRSEGKPSPSVLKEDSDYLVQHLIEVENVQKGWIGVHGESIGGVVACYLAARNEAISLLIADRTFSSLPAAAEYVVAKWASCALKRVIGWEAENITNFLTAIERGVFSICTCDPDDAIIAHSASLKVGVARKLATILFENGKSENDTPLVNGAVKTLKANFNSSSWDWLRNNESVDSFVQSLQQLIDQYRAMVEGSEISLEGLQFVNFANLLNPITNAMNILLFLDGHGGQYLGQAFALHGKEIAGETNSKAEALKTEKPEFSPIRDFFLCYIFWGGISLNHSLPDLRNEQNSMVQEWNLCGFQGTFGPSKFVSLTDALPPLHRFMEEYESLLSEAKCLEPLQNIMKVLGSLERSGRSLRNAISREHDRSFLISLSCGHNGVFSVAEERLLCYSLSIADWMKM